MKTRPTLTINLHANEGRGMVQLGLDDFNSAEREFMVRLFGIAEKEGVSFEVAEIEDGRQQMKFTIGTPYVDEVPNAAH